MWANWNNGLLACYKELLPLGKLITSYHIITRCPGTKMGAGQRAIIYLGMVKYSSAPAMAYLTLAFCAAASMKAATLPGCDSMGTWLELSVSVVALIF